jgi:hypothetical protein
MIDIPKFVKKAADKSGFIRESFDEANIPTSVSNICVLPFFGDLRSSFVLSSLLLKRYREEIKGSKYFILCSWPGHKMLYPFVDEYWSVKDFSGLKEFFSRAYGFDNPDDAYLHYIQQLNQFFDDLVTVKDLEGYYSNGITKNFAGKFQKVLRTFPMIPSTSLLGNEFNRRLANRVGLKIIVYPAIMAKSWQHTLENKKVSKDFWVALVERLLKEGFVPVVVNNYGTHDISDVFAQECVYISDHDLSKITCAMRAADGVLDIFSDFSRLAVIARSPFVANIERLKYMKMKEYELDDLCAFDLPKQYIFSFSTILGENSRIWNTNIFDGIILKLNSFLPDINKDTLPPASALSEEVSYENVRKRKINRFGAKFIKIERD